MSAQEIQAMAQQFAEAFNNKNIKVCWTCSLTI